ncbi:MAG TPA: TIGR02281 family clan AA aspartic protease [Pseudolabrys sp.]|nr:TIGR02281 family clan AA aspartic protease [Pseudolabrys sp.]
MRNVVILAAAVVVGATYAAKFADRETASQSVERSAPSEPIAVTAQSGSGGRTVELAGDRHGHFPVDADVDGQRIDFIIDTGASLVTLRESDAASLGIHPMPADYNAVVSTANGRIKAARARLNRIEVGDITVYNVSALVLPDEALGKSLLGASFLSRLTRYEYANGRMVLEQ